MSDHGLLIPSLMLMFNSHTGLAYSHSGNVRREIKVFTRWDRMKDHVKTPSVIKFEAQDDIWGVPAKHLPGALRWFKLLLVNRQDLDEEIRTSVQLQEARAALEALGKSAVEVISIFLKRIFEHAVEKLKIEMGAETVETSRFHVVLTVPAIWPEYARRRMKRAVDLSGILKTRPIGPTTHDYISEPEAAALATLADFDGLPNVKACAHHSRLNYLANVFLGGRHHRSRRLWWWHG